MKSFQFICLLFLLSGTVFISCKKEKLNPNSVITDPAASDSTALDKYILREFVTPYNISILYKYVDAESDMNYNLSPANDESAIRMTRLTQYLGIGPYDAVTGSKEFIRSYFPKMLNYIGSPAYNNNGTIVLGTAEGGRKINMFNLNKLTAGNAFNVAYLNDKYFHTMHHEFGHILNQLKPYPNSFREISGGKYVQDSWNDKYPSDFDAINDGFISAYASKEDSEDFVEMASFYITMSAKDWEDRISRGSGEGKDILQRKIDIVKKYYEESWNISLDSLRSEILKRQASLKDFDQLDIR